MGKALAISAVVLFTLLLIGIGSVFESRTFRASVSGRVTDTAGKPIAGATVEYCLPNAPGDTIAYDMSTRTDSEGRYSMRLPAFTAALDSSPNPMRQIRISADGYTPFCTYGTLEKGRNPDRVYVLSTDSEG